MDRFPVSSVLAPIFLIVASLLSAQTTNAPAGSTQPAAATSQTSQVQTEAASIPANAPRMSRETRFQIIKDFETQLVYSRTSFPMGQKGLKLKDGVISPNGPELQSMLALWGPAIKPGDPAHISFVHIKDNCIHFDLNGGAIRRKKWYQHIQISGANGGEIPLSNDQSTDNPHGSYLEIYFDKYVPEMTATQLRNLMYPVIDFNAKNKEEAYLDTVPPKVKEAIKAHHVLVGMNSEMVIHAMGKAPRKVREKDGDTEYEEWIYGEPPQDVNFVRIVGDEVVRIETMKVGGEKIVRTEKEVILPKPAEEEEAKKEQERPANAPSLRRPGESSEDVPQPSREANPAPIQPAPPMDPGPPGQSGPGDIIGQR